MNETPDQLDGLRAEQLLDIDSALARLDQDHAFLAKLYAMFLEDGPQRAKTFADAVAKGDYQTAAKAAHSLKGMAGTINAPALMDHCLVLEKTAKTEDAAAMAPGLDRLQLLLGEVTRRVQLYLDNRK